MTTEGRWNILKCVFGSDIYIQDFAPVVVKLSNQWFRSFEFEDFGDPACRHKKDTGISTRLTLKNQFSIDIRSIYSLVESGVDIINQKINTLINGKPSLMVNDDDTTNMVAAILQGAYYYKDNEDEPYKEGYYEHVADALRYGAINLFQNKPRKRYDFSVGSPIYNTNVVAA